MALLSATEILAASDTAKTLDVFVPGWGGHVRIKTLSAAEAGAWEQGLAAADDAERWRTYAARFCAAVLIGEDGKLLFTPQQVLALAEKSNAALDCVLTAAKDFNGLGVNAVKTAEKNSETTVV